MSVDRTREFLAIVSSSSSSGTGGGGGGAHAARAAGGPRGFGAAGLAAPGHHHLGAGGVAGAGATAPPGGHTGFLAAVREVSTDLHSTSLKLSALTKRECGKPCLCPLPWRRSVCSARARVGGGVGAVSRPSSLFCDSRWCGAARVVLVSSSSVDTRVFRLNASHPSPSYPPSPSDCDSDS